MKNNDKIKSKCLVTIVTTNSGLIDTSKFISSFKDSSGICFLVISSMLEGQESYLKTLISKNTSFPVTLAKNGDKIYTDHVYIQPANFKLEIIGDTVNLSSDAKKNSSIYESSILKDNEYFTKSINIVMAGDDKNIFYDIENLTKSDSLFLVQKRQNKITSSHLKKALENGCIDLILQMSEMKKVILNFIENKKHSFLDSHEQVENVSDIKAINSNSIGVSSTISNNSNSKNVNKNSSFIEKIKEVDSKNIVKDLNDHRAKIAEIEESRKDYSIILDNITDGWWDWDIQNNTGTISENFRKTFGYKETEVTGMIESLKKIFDKNDLELFLDSIYHYKNLNESFSVPIKGKHKKGNIIWLFAKGRFISGSKKVIISFIDISTFKDAENKLEQLAYRDSLTNLANRKFFNEYLAKTISKAKRNNYKVALVYIDLDDFKVINDTLGHQGGDILLVEVAKRIQSCARDIDFTARLGGDEFVVIIENVSNPTYTSIVASRILESISKPFNIHEKKVSVSASIGICILPDSAKNESELLKHADIAMYESKNKGKDSFNFFSRDLNNEIKRKSAIEKHILNALNNDELKFYYQPQFEMQTNKVVGCESLLRLNIPKYGYISPLEIIPITEETGLTEDVIDWSLKTSAETLISLSEYLKIYPEFALSVNFSLNQLIRINLTEKIQNILVRNNLNASNFRIELTGTSIFKNINQIKTKLYELREIGVSIAIDDFGAGLFSIEHLKSLPIGFTKIDSCFTKEIGKSSNSDDLVKAIIKLCKSLKIETIAQGVESKSQVEFLLKNGCLVGQGYQFSKPMPLDKLSNFFYK